MTEARIRMATVEDAMAINTIYETYILETAVTFEYDPVPLKEFQERVQKILQKLPYLVCEIDGKIVGYAYLAPFKSRAAYAWDLEITIYLQKEYHKRGIARALYTALFEIAKRQGYINLYAFITDSNENSIRMHESMGFERVGYYPETGFKFGTWWGLDVMSKRIGSIEKSPNQPRSIHDLPKEELEEIFRACNQSIKR